MSREIPIKHGDGAYPVLIGTGLLAGVGREVMARLGPARVVIVTDENVAPLYLDQVKAGFSDVKMFAIVVPAGEETKSFAQLEMLTNGLLEAGVSRSDVVVALGGGVIGDLAGLAASLVKRGVNLVQVPTTLLAQVDSSVGGKTGINTQHGKNLIGSFYPPKLVVADVGTLETLPEQEFRAGYAEVVKHAILAGENALKTLEDTVDSFFAHDPDVLKDTIECSIKIKGGIVTRDEKEAGPRMLLNLGHSFGHAIEALAGYGTVKHGEAVAIGICMALQFAGSKDLGRIAALLEKASLPTNLQAAGIKTTADEMKRFMTQDKKNAGEAIRLVVPRGPGDVAIEEVGPETLDRFFENVTF